ncbi:hypothetical protein [Streptomyces sp. DSM 15324]|uniref:hypothetical protein n=1 Tax=Streptomyces sp. DSM 15324 TaxID=1739111 RepID=UPI00131C0EC9|nr:hypothetical protein [Streptomyces sp. DSM 15324]
MGGESLRAVVMMASVIAEGMAHIRLQLSVSRSLWLPMILSGLVVPVGCAATFAWPLVAAERTRVVAGAVVLSALILTLAQTGTSPVDDRVQGRRALLHVNGATAHGYLAGLAGDALIRVIFPIMVGWVASAVLGVEIAPVGVWLIFAVLCVATLTGVGFLFSSVVSSPESSTW